MPQFANGSWGRVGLRSVFVMLLLATLVPSDARATGCPSVKEKNGHELRFLGRDDNADGTSTWNYTLEWDGSGEPLDHFIIQICPDATVVSSTPAYDSVSYDGSTGIYGIRWENDGSFPSHTPVSYSFTLDRQYEVKKIKWAVPTGYYSNKSTICGPSRYCKVENPLPIQNLVCGLVDPCTCEVALMWTNPEPDHHHVLVSVDGRIAAVLPSGSESTTLTLPDPSDHEICVRNVFDLEEFEPFASCGECSGKVSQLTLRYDGATTSFVEVVQKNGETVFAANVDPGEEFSFAGTDNGTLGSNTKIYVDGSLHAEVHTSCSQPIGVGFSYGDFTITAGASRNGGPFCEGDEGCSECAGKVNALTLQYNGAVEAYLEVEQGNGHVVFSGNVAPGGQFSFVGTNDGGDFGNSIWISVDGVNAADFHTSCSQEIGPGLVNGPFEVIAGESEYGGPLCPVAGAGNCSECDGKVDSLVLEYTGDSSTWVEIRQKDGTTVFDGLVSPSGQISIVAASGGDDDDDDDDDDDNGGSNFGTEIKIYIEGVLHTVIHTSCSQPIGPGLISGDFVVVEGTSVDGGPLCPIDAPKGGLVGGLISCEYDIEGASACVCCTVSCPDVPVVHPKDIACVPDPLDCSVDVSWTNPSSYTSIDVLLDGVLVLTVPGTATSATLPGPITGAHQVCLRATTTCGEIAPDACCDFDCQIEPPPPVVGLECMLLDPCTCETAVTWTNGSSDYDSIEVFIDGVPVATLAGSVTSTIVTLPGTVTHSVCVVPSRNGVSGQQTCCDAQCPDIPAMAPVDLTCDLGSPPDCSTVVSWVNTSNYDQITVTRNGAIVASLPGSAEQVTVPIPGPGSYEICLNGATICGEAFPEVCCTVVCPFPPDPIVDLTCTLTDLCTCEYALAWTNGDRDYDEIRVYLNGTLNVVLPGSTTSLDLNLPDPGTFDICLEPIRYTLAGPQACCSVTCDDVPAIPPSNLMCTSDRFDCSAAVTWVNDSLYASIEVYVDGVLNQTLPGTATSADLAGPLTGLHEICVQGTTICGEAFPPVCCSFDCMITPPQPVDDLVCELTDPCTCSVDVSWTNTEMNYDSLQVLIDGTLTQTLAGNATSTSVILPSDGGHDICIVPIRNGVSGAQTCCMVTCPVTDGVPPVLLVCESDMNCNGTVTWMNPSLYATVEVFVNGTSVATVPGSDTMITVPLPLPGLNEVCLVATTICGEIAPAVCCEIDCPIDPPPVLDLELTLTDICTCTFAATWTNGDLYDAIEIFLDGALIDTLPGGSMATSVSLPAPGMAELCVVGVINSVGSDPACSTFTCPEVPATAPAALTCDVGLPPTCTTTVTWMNTSDYASLTISLDGVVVANLSGDAESALVDLGSPGAHTICINGTTICGDPLPEVCCSVDCPFPPDPVTDLECTLADLCTCTFDVTWMNANADYDEVRVLVDGAIAQVLPGDATMATVLLPAPGNSEICIVPVRTTLTATPTCCLVTCDEVPQVGPGNLMCTPDPLDCSVTATWMNLSSYEFIEVRLDGVLVETLPGDATSYTNAGPLPGGHEICLTAQTICGDPLPPVCCLFDCTITPPPPVTDLLCDLVDPCTCTADLSWSNGAADYDSLQVFVNGTLVSTLAGNATATTVVLPGPGARDICVVPVRNGVSGAQECCVVECPVTDPLPPTMFLCVVNDATCEVDISWVNPSTYASLQLLLDGVVVQDLMADAEQATVTLTLPGVNEICLQGTTICGDAFPPVCCNVACPTLVPPPVLDVTCTLDDVCDCTTTVSWTNGGVYDAVRVLQNGVPVIELPGDATSHTFDLPGPGLREVCVIPVVNGVDGRTTCCDIDCPTVPATPVIGLSCLVGLPPSCEVVVEWMNTSDYSSLDVLVDGVLAQTLPGTAELATLNLPGSGEFEICVVGTTICNEVVPATCCTVECPFFPMPVVNLACDVELCSCDLIMTWTNPETNYDELRILENGLLIASLPGDATTFQLPGLAVGAAEYCVVPVRDTLTGEATCCMVDCLAPPQPPAPTNVVCNVSDLGDCAATVTWQNGGEYSSIEVVVEGFPQFSQTLPGDATTAMFSLPGVTGSVEVCVNAVSICGDAVAPACCTVQCQPEFVRGDCNVDGIVNVADPIKITRMLFQGLPESTCLDACDHNDDGFVDISDVVFLVTYIFSEGDLPPSPFFACGFDPTDDAVGCNLYDQCP